MDFTDLVLRNAQQISVTHGFFLGGAQVVFEAQRAGDAVLGVSILSNVWYDCDGPSLAVNETRGAYTSVTDLDVTGTAFCGYARSKAAGLPAATKTFSGAAAGAGAVDVDFSDVLLFPSAGIAWATVSAVGAGRAPPFVAALPAAGAPLRVAVDVGSGAAPGAVYAVSVDQSNRSSWSEAAVAARGA